MMNSDDEKNGGPKRADERRGHSDQPLFGRSIDALGRVEATGEPPSPDIGPDEDWFGWIEKVFEAEEAAGEVHCPTRETWLRHRLVEAWRRLRDMGRGRDHLDERCLAKPARASANRLRRRIRRGQAAALSRPLPRRRSNRRGPRRAKSAERSVRPRPIGHVVGIR